MNIKSIKKKLALINPVVLLSLLPNASHAADVTSILTHAQTWLQGSVAKGVGMLAVIGCGYMCIFQQRLPKSQFLMVLFGLGIVFGASSLYGTLVGA